MAMAASRRSKQAEYLIADMYHYSSDAVDEITQRFFEAVEQIKLASNLFALVYNRNVDAFVLSCPPEDGRKLYDVLQDIFAAYHNAYPAEHNPSLTRCEPAAPQTKNLPVPGFKLPVSTDQAARQIVVHRTELDKRVKAKAIFLSDLERDLARHFKKTLERQTITSNASTRIVKLVVFNRQADEWEEGPLRIDTELPAADDNIRDALHSGVEWLPVQQHPSHVSISEEAPIAEHAWNFVSKKPTVEQWLAGMGEQELVPPDVAADRPHVEVKSSNLVSRARVPVGAVNIKPVKPGQTTSEQQSDTIDNSTSTSVSTKQPKNTIQTLSRERAREPEHECAITQRAQNSSSEITSQQSSDKDDDDADSETESEMRARLDRIMALATKGHERRPGVLSSVAESTSVTTSRELTTAKATASLQTAKQSYARIDNHGLTGNPKAQALWEQDLVQATTLPRTNDHHETAHDTSHLQGESENLITFSDTTEFFTVRSIGSEPDDTPVQRLATQPADAMDVHHRTMRQQARKKNKNKGYRPPDGVEGTPSHLRKLNTQRMESQHGAQRQETITARQKTEVTTSNGACSVVKHAVEDDRQVTAPAEDRQWTRPGVNVMRIRFGTCLLAQESSCTTLQHAYRLDELEQALQQQESEIEFVPQALDLNECAALHASICGSTRHNFKDCLPQLHTSIKMKLTNLDGSITISEVQWQPANGCVLDALLVLDHTRLIVCPQDLWDGEVLWFRRAADLEDALLIDFVSSIKIQQRHRQNTSNRLKLTATVPMTDNRPAFSVDSIELLKILIQPPTSPSLQQANRESPGTRWVSSQAIPTTVNLVAGHANEISAIAMSKDELAASNRYTWQTHLTVKIEDKAEQSGPDWYDIAFTTLCGIMNKLYLGKHRPGEAMNVQKQRQQQPIFW